jgi:hypothetical protein
MAVDGKIEDYYRVGEPVCADGCCTPVFTKDMEANNEGPLFYVETEYKAELAAKLVGVTLSELEAALKLYKEYQGFKKDGLKSIGFTDGADV